MEITGQDIVAAILVGGFFAAFLIPPMLSRFRGGGSPSEKETPKNDE